MADPNNGFVFGGRSPSAPPPSAGNTFAPAQVQTQAQTASTPSPIGGSGFVFGGRSPSAPPPGYTAQQQDPSASPDGALFEGFNAEEYAQEQARVTSVFKMLEENPKGDTLANKDWRTVADMLVRVTSAAKEGTLDKGTQESVDEYVNPMLWQYGDELRFYLDQRQEGWWDENYTEPDKGNWLQRNILPTVGAVSGAPLIKQFIDLSEKEFQRALGGYDAIRRNVAKVEASLFDSIGWEKGAEGIRDAGLTEATDRGEDGRLNPREAMLGLDGEWGGTWGDTLDTVLGIVYDPLTWTGVGPAARALAAFRAIRVGSMSVKTVGTAAQGTNIIRQIRRSGLRSLSEVDRAMVEVWMRAGVEEARSKGSRRATSSADKVFDKQLRALDGGGRSGIKIAGNTWLPTGGLANKMDELSVGITGRGGRTGRPFFTRPGPMRTSLNASEAEKAASLGDDVSRLEKGLADTPDEWAHLVEGDIMDEIAELSAKMPELPVGISDTVERGLVAALRDNKVMNAVRKVLKPRSGVHRAGMVADTAGADALDTATVVTKAQMDARILDAASGLDNKAVKAAIKDMGSEDKLLRELNKALSTKTNYTTLLRRWKDTGRDSAAAVLENLHASRKMVFDASIAGGMDPKLMRDLWNYIPRTYSDDIANNISKQLKVMGDLERGDAINKLSEWGLRFKPGGEVEDVVADVRNMFDVSSQSGAANTRTFAKETQDLFSLNDQARAAFKEIGLNDLGDVFESNVLKAVATRSHSAFLSTMITDITDNLASITDDAGRKFAYVAPTKKDLLRVLSDMKADGAGMAGYVSVELPNGGVRYLEKTMHEELSKTRRFLSSTADMGVALKNVASANAMWAASATVFMPFNMAFHLRNNVGNVFNTVLGGLRNPIRFTEAYYLQRRHHAVRGFMKKNGGSYDNALEKMGDISDLTAARLKGIRADGIIGNGQVGDIFTGTGSQGKVATRVLGWKPITTGRVMGEAIEHNARIALYIDGLEKGMSGAASAANVRKHLFDYSDLTKQENDYFRTVSRFYTFMRKNTALQAYAIAHYPGRVVNAQRIAEAATDAFAGSEIPTPEGMILPDWADERNLKLREGGLLGKIGMGPNLIGVDTPLLAAADSLGSMGAALSVIPGMSAILPQAATYGEAEDKYARALGLFSGMPVSAIELFVGGRFGRDPFTGGPLDNEGAGSVKHMISKILPEAIQNSSRYNDLMEEEKGVESFAATFLPIIDKVDSMYGKIVMEDTEQGRSLALVNYLTGLSTYDITEDRQEKGRNALIWGAQDALNNLTDNHPDLLNEEGRLPTISDLEKAGYVTVQNRALEILLYGDPEDQEELTLGLIPAAIKDELRKIYPDMYLGPDEPISPTDYQAIARNADEVIRATRTSLESQGLSLSDEEYNRLRTQLSKFSTNAWLKDQGIEAETNANRFIESPYDTSDADNRERWNAIMGDIMTPEEYAQLNPLLDDMTRALREAAEAGLSRDDFTQWVIEDYLTRKERGNLPGPLFGTDTDAVFPLERFRDGTLTDEDLEQFRKRSWEQRAVVNWVFNNVIGRAPTEVETTQFVYQTLLTVGQQKALGLERGAVIPSRENTQTDQEKYNDASTLLGAIQANDYAYRAPSQAGSSTSRLPTSFAEILANQGG